MGSVSRLPADGAQKLTHEEVGRFLKHLLNAPDLAAFAARIASFLEAEGLTGVLVGWRIDDGGRYVHDETRLQPGDHELAARARFQVGGWAVDEHRKRVAAAIHSEGGRYGIGVVADGTSASRERIQGLCSMLAPLAETRFEKSRLSDSLLQLAHSEQLQNALFTIADMASSDMELDRMLCELHRIVGRFMYAENFFIALYDDARDALRFIYLVDTTDPLIQDAKEFIPMSVMERGLTWYLIRDRKPLMGSLPDIHAQISGPPRDIGTDCYDWLGVPVVFGERVRGVLVVQSYVERPRYTLADQALLSYVGSHILTALDRKLAQEELELRVQERTQELRRSVKVQETVFRIAELSHTAGNPSAFFGAVHRIVGEFMDARNFYIATLAADGEQLEFPYYVDEHLGRRSARRMGSGLSEYVIRQGRAMLFDKRQPESYAELVRLQDDGIVVLSGPDCEAWLGVPLLLGDRAIGLLAVQSYTPGVGYTEGDKDLLTFVSYQVANGLERQRAAAEVKAAYEDLEQRVATRTAELSEQIEVREQIERRLKHQVLHDSLTGLPNRAYLRDQLARAFAEKLRNPGFQFAVLFMDLDRFKVINDSVGHLVGDALLQEVAARFGRCARGGRDMVARLGGDEFAIYMEIEGPEGALRMAQRIIDALKEPVRVNGKELFTGVSVGIAMCTSHCRSPEDVLRDADIAMYRAKSSGRHRFEVFDEQLHSQALELLETESDLRRGMTRQEFIPYFQPIVTMKQHSVVGYEALMRWNHPQRGVLAPGAFLHVAEAIGTMEALDWLLFEQVMQVIPRLLSPGQYVNLNFSARHFRSPDIDDRFMALLRAHGVHPEQVRIEVTEGALLENPEAVGAVFRRLHRCGVYVVLDDFGTGYSSLSYLHRFNMHTLKIDRSFVGDLNSEDERSSTAVVRAIMALSKSQRMEVVAEGIETEDQRDALLALGCELGQGYFFARPQPWQLIVSGRGSANKA